MKWRFFSKIIFVIFLTYIHFVCYGNSLSYYQEYLNLSKKEYTAGNYTKSLEYLIEIRNQAKDNNLPETEISALNNMGLVYTGLLNYERAMEYYLEAYQIALKHADKRNEMRILNNISQLYFLSNDLDKANQYLNTAYKIALELKDNMGAATLMVSLGIISNEMGHLELAENYIDAAMKIIKDELKDSTLFTLAAYVKIENLYLKGMYDHAEQMALDIMERYTKYISAESRVEYLLIFSQIYEEKKNFQKAIYYAKKSLENNPKLSAIIEIYEHLSNIYRNVNSPTIALVYQDSVIIMKDSLVKLNDMSRVTNSQVQFDLINSEKKLEENKIKQKQERTLFILIIVFIIILIIIVIWTFNIRSTKNKQLKIITELELEKEKNEKLLLEQQLKEQETLSLLEQERLNNEIKEKMLLKQQLREQETLSLLERERFKNEMKMKNKQLVSKTLFQSNKNDIVKEIIHTLSEIPDENQIPELKSVIRKLKSQIKEPASWDSFLTYFEQINPAFLSSLNDKCPDLSANEIRLASYIYLNLDTKEIAKLLNITPEYCRKKKYRLAEKMGISVMKIHNFLINIV